MKKLKHIIAFACFTCLVVGVFLLSLASQSVAAIFCVSSVDQLHTYLGIASGNGEDDVIQIQRGTYTGNFIYVSTENFGLTIEGGYTNGSCSLRDVDPANTVLDGEANGPVLVLSAPGVTAGFTIDGLTLQNGNATGYNGGGLFIEKAGGVIIRNNSLKDNSTNGQGGGAYIYGPDVIIENTIIANNSAGVAGGYSIRGGTVTLNNNEVSGNTASETGGGYINSVSATLIDNNISNNNANQYGGIDIASATIALSNNTIAHNSGGRGAGACLYGREINLVNNVITSNITSNFGGGLKLGISTPGTLSLINNVICYNSANDGGAGIYIESADEFDRINIYNNVIWANIADEGADLYILNDNNNNYIPAELYLYSNDFDMSTSGTWIQIPPSSIDTSNLNNVDPEFVDAANNVYHLGDGSPCINVGDNSAPELPDLDKDGNPRIMDGIVDMGAYEYPGAAIPIIDAFTAFPTSGEVPLTVNFTCVAHDFGGSIAS